MHCCQKTAFSGTFAALEPGILEPGIFRPKCFDPKILAVFFYLKLLISVHCCQKTTSSGRFLAREFYELGILEPETFEYILCQKTTSSGSFLIWNF